MLSRRALLKRIYLQNQSVSRVQNHLHPLYLNTTRCLSSTTSNASSNLSKEAPKVEGQQEETKHNPSWFSRNPGVTLGGIIMAIALYVYRGSKNKKNFDKIQQPIAEEAVISPYEAWELRSKNDITPDMFEELRQRVLSAFPQQKASMYNFDQFLGFQLASKCPQGIQKAYHLERVLMSLKQDEEKKIDTKALLIAFSMAVKGSVDERLKCLYNLATDASNAEQITREQLAKLLDLLLDTYQIPSEKRVLPIVDIKYPFQEYKAANGLELIDAAMKAQVDAKHLTQEEANKMDTYTFEAFSKIMKGKTICLWGECFSNSKKKMKN